MELKRSELLPGVFLNHLSSPKFKTACISVSLLSQLTRETAAMNALLPSVLRRGTAEYDSMEKLSAYMDGLYGVDIEPSVLRIGEIHAIGFFGSLPEGDFLPGGESVLSEAVELMAKLLLNPATRGGLLLPQYVDSEKEKLIELIKSRVNNKRGYALSRCIEEMCCFEDFAAGRLGDLDSAQAIHYKKLSKHYRKLLQSSPVELFYCGRTPAAKVEQVFRDAFASLPRGEIDYDIGTDLRMNAIEAAPRYVEESLEVNQAKLVMGFRLGECMEEPDFAAIRVFNNVFGGCPTGKLFTNVREKLSLCYYASSALMLHKGLMLVDSGIDGDSFEQVKGEILRQLDNIRIGEISEEEFSSAKKCIASDLRAVMDSQAQLEGFWLSQILNGLDYGPLELAELCEQVSREDVMEIAKSVELDLIYLLKGGETQEDDDNDDEED